MRNLFIELYNKVRVMQSLEPESNQWPRAKQINILGSRHHPAEKVAMWCDFFSAVKSRYSYAYKYAFNGVWAIYHLSIVCDM